jgi:hypothetical protein
MSSYHELHLYMIDNYRDLKMDDGKVLFSESTLQKIMPRHIKKAGDRYKQMCGCQVCIIFKNMYSCLRLWKQKIILQLQTEINTMQQRSCNRLTKQDILDAYKSKVMYNGTLFQKEHGMRLRNWLVQRLASKMMTVLDPFTNLDA